MSKETRISKTDINMKRADSPANKVTLAQMRSGQSGKIVGIGGGRGLARKLDALGIRVGKKITKISAQWMRGPVLLRQGHTQAAVGFGMASRVVVEVDGEDKI